MVLLRLALLATRFIVTLPVYALGIRERRRRSMYVAKCPQFVAEVEEMDHAGHHVVGNQKLSCGPTTALEERGGFQVLSLYEPYASLCSSSGELRYDYDADTQRHEFWIECKCPAYLTSDGSQTSSGHGPNSKALTALQIVIAPTSSTCAIPKCLWATVYPSWKPFASLAH